jgi:hypothetical protein
MADHLKTRDHFFRLSGVRISDVDCISIFFFVLTQVKIKDLAFTSQKLFINGKGTGNSKLVVPHLRVHPLRAGGRVAVRPIGICTQNEFFRFRSWENCPGTFPGYFVSIFVVDDKV